MEDIAIVDHLMAGSAACGVIWLLLGLRSFGLPYRSAWIRRVCGVPVFFMLAVLPYARGHMAHHGWGFGVYIILGPYAYFWLVFSTIEILVRAVLVRFGNKNSRQNHVARMKGAILLVGGFALILGMYILFRVEPQPNPDGILNLSSYFSVRNFALKS